MSECVECGAGLAESLLPALEGDRRSERLEQRFDPLETLPVAGGFGLQLADLLPILDALDKPFEAD